MKYERFCGKAIICYIKKNKKTRSTYNYSKKDAGAKHRKRTWFNLILDCKLNVLKVLLALKVIKQNPDLFIYQSMVAIFLSEFLPKHNKCYDVRKPIDDV